MFFVLYFLLLVFSILVYMLYLAIQPLGFKSVQWNQSVNQSFNGYRTVAAAVFHVCTYIANLNDFP